MHTAVHACTQCCLMHETSVIHLVLKFLRLGSRCYSLYGRMVMRVYEGMRAMESSMAYWSNEYRKPLRDQRNAPAIWSTIREPLMQGKYFAIVQREPNRLGVFLNANANDIVLNKHDCLLWEESFCSVDGCANRGLWHFRRLVACKPMRYLPFLFTVTKQLIVLKMQDGWPHQSIAENCLLRICNTTNSSFQIHERFQVFTAVTMKNAVFSDVTSCGSCKNRRFGGT
jgi:hypothetical protein